jgi:hypothetical protein
MLTTLLDAPGLSEHTSRLFQRELVAGAICRGLNPSYLAAVMAHETGGTFDPRERNADSGATGLLQWLPSSAPLLGTSIEAIAAMDQLEQLALVWPSYRPKQHRLKHWRDYFMANFLPSATGAPPSTVLFRRPSAGYAAHKGLDHDGDGAITVDDMTRSWARTMRAAQARAPIKVHTRACGASWPGVAIVAVAGIAAAFWESKK